MALATLSIDLVAKLATLQADMDRATRVVQKQAAGMERAFAGVRTAALAIGSTLGLVFAPAVIARFVNVIVDGLDALKDLSDATGSTVENLSALEDVARRNGQTLDEVGNIVIKFNKALSDAKADNDVGRALAQIGLNAKELKKEDPAEALRRVAVALAGFADDGEKARLVQELFGKSLRESAPFLKDLAEQGRLVATVTAEQAEQAERFNNALFGLQAAVNQTARDIVGPLLPALTQLVKDFNAAEGAAGRLKFALENLPNPITGIAIPIIQRLRGPANTGGATGASGGPVLPSLADARPSGSGFFLQGAGINPAGLTSGLRNLVRPVRPVRGAGTRETPESLVAAWLRAQGVVADDGTTEGITAVIDEIDRAFTAASTTVQGWVEAQRNLVADDGTTDGIVAVIDDIEKRASDAGNVAQQLGLTFASAFEDAIVEGQKLRDVIQGLAQDILRIVVRKTLTEPLAGAIAGLFSGKATGGAVGAGIGYLVGEQGPELFVPNDSGRIVPNGQFRGAGGGGDVRVIVNAPAGTQVARQEQRSTPTGREVEVWLAQRIASGDGPVPGALRSRGVNLSGALPRRA